MLFCFLHEILHLGDTTWNEVTMLLIRFDALLFLQKLQHKKFDPRQKFLQAIMVVRAMVRLQRLRFTPEPLNLGTARNDPYRIKLLRKVNPSVLTMQIPNVA